MNNTYVLALYRYQYFRNIFPNKYSSLFSIFVQHFINALNSIRKIYGLLDHKTTILLATLQGGILRHFTSPFPKKCNLSNMGDQIGKILPDSLLSFFLFNS
jgi:hypothetical protein